MCIRDSITTGPAIITLGPTQTLFFRQGTSLYGNCRTVENRNPNTQFSPISVPGIKTVLIPLHTQYDPFPIFESAVIFELKMRKINSCTILGKTGIWRSNSQRSTL